MPNWCDNQVRINGPKKEIEKFVKLIGKKEPNFDFNLFIPYPDEFKKLDDEAKNWEKEAEEFRRQGKEVDYSKQPSDGYNQGGYQWCIQNWGTKWNVEKECEWDNTDERGIKLIFQTAWSPPEPVISAISEKFPKLTLTLEYESLESSYAGYYVAKAGDVLEESCYEFDEEEDENDEDDDITDDETGRVCKLVINHISKEDTNDN